MRGFLLIVCVIAVGGPLGPACVADTRSDEAVDSAMAAWRDLIDAPEMSDVRLSAMVSEWWTDAGMSREEIYAKADSTPRNVQTHKVVRRKNDLKFVFTSRRGTEVDSVDPQHGTHVEQIAANGQAIHVQQTLGPEGSLRVSGELERTDPSFPTDYLGAFRYLFGRQFWNKDHTYWDAWEKSTNRKSRRVPSGELVAAFSFGEGDYSLTFSNFEGHGMLPVSLKEVPKSGQGTHIDVTNIQWQFEHPVPLMKTLETIGTNPGSTTIFERFELVDAELSAGIDNADLLPTASLIPDGTKVSASDVPFSCVWLEGRIVPQIDRTIADSATGQFRNTSWLWICVIGGISLLAIFGSFRYLKTGVRQD